MRTWLLLSLLVIAPLAHAVEMPYDEHADAGAQPRAALAAGKTTHKPTHAEKRVADQRVVRGGEGGPRQFRPSSGHQPALRHSDPDRPQWWCRRPASCYTTRAGELANARKMSDDGIYQFFDHVAHARHAP
ncbi:thiol reductase thioredoxin [Xanthomonas oryzae]|uniref:thiol reductase thioredoxin n=1 Tax=Xanthomonas oryzae TaxID=347 RepID=UPI000ABEE28F|nr:thiol reductase thioredoxin [Xanthomonas oryzae]